MDDNHMDETEQKLEMEVAPALIAVHPNQKSVSVSVGSDLRVFNLQDCSRVQLLDDNGGHKDSLRAIRYSGSGKLFVSAGDDKLVKVWDTNYWRCFCSAFVSCLAFVSSSYYAQGLLVSGSGDSTVRLWDYTSGALLDACDVGAKAELLNSNDQGQEEIMPAVTDLCVTSDGSLVAVAIQSLSGILLLRCDISAKTLSVAKVVVVKGEAFIPTSIGSAPSFLLLWMVMGASTSHGHEHTHLARLRVVSGFAPDQSESSVLDDKEIPGAEPLLESLQGKLSIGEEAFALAAEAVKTAMRNLLIKKQYSNERRELRKRGRNDKKNQKTD